jgi:hypothetical protein
MRKVLAVHGKATMALFLMNLAASVSLLAEGMGHDAVGFIHATQAEDIFSLVCNEKLQWPFLRAVGVRWCPYIIYIIYILYIYIIYIYIYIYIFTGGALHPGPPHSVGLEASEIAGPPTLRG